jgi:hypothetical protein
MDKKKFLFVTGCFRSGTSLLYACLNQHPQIALLYEASLLDSYLPDSLFLHPRWMDNANAWGKFLSRHGLPHDPRKAQELFSTPTDIYYAYGAKKNALYVGEKCPSYTVMLPEILTKYPEAKIITISRHPAAIFKSVIRASKKDPFFARRGMIERNLFSQKKMLQDLVALKKSGANILSLTYDELAGYPEDTTRLICSYLDLPYEEAMCHLECADLSAVYAAEHHIKLRSGKIEPTRQTTEEKVPVSLDALEVVWRHWQQTIDWLRGKNEILPEHFELPPEIQKLEARGQNLLWREKWKRRVYHLAPAEAIRILRSVKLVVRHVASAEVEYYPQKIMQWNKMLAAASCLLFLLVGGYLAFTYGGRVSSIAIFVLVPLIVGWCWGPLPIVWVSMLASFVWTVAQHLHYLPKNSWIISAWNFCSMSMVFIALGIFSWHLKAVFLDHLKNQRND